MITIRMPGALLDAWLAALRSGDYTQGRDRLRDDEGGYCCLGVLQHVADGEVEMITPTKAASLPTRHWLSEHAVQFSDAKNPVSKTPYLPSIGRTASVANDGGCSGDGGYSFIEIADAIEACAERLPR